MGVTACPRLTLADRCKRPRLPPGRFRLTAVRITLDAPKASYPRTPAITHGVKGSEIPTRDANDGVPIRFRIAFVANGGQRVFVFFSSVGVFAGNADAERIESRMKNASGLRGLC